MKKLFFITLFMFAFVDTNLFGMKKVKHFFQKLGCFSTSEVTQPKVIKVKPKKNSGLDFRQFFENQIQVNKDGALTLKVTREAISRKHKVASLKSFLLSNIMPLFNNNNIKQVKLVFNREPIMPEFPTLYIHTTIKNPQAFLEFVDALPYPLFSSTFWFSKKLQNNESIKISTNLTKHAVKTLSTTSLLDLESEEFDNEIKK